MITYGPYMECGYYPHVKQDFWSRVRVAWRILWRGEFFPQPEPWYEGLYRLAYGPLGTCCRKAVEKAEKEFAKGGKATTAIRLKEAQEWSRVYAAEQGIYPHAIRPGTWTFLLEFWVAKLSDKF